ncbi:hypothetical protein ACFC1L_39810 [Streptomyces sp. NPDC056210]|uniref:hypothetical protein n=1 Tax=Streptomyces sp. NPDC056210 TaxID=3345746 RepID=UPI0035D62E48
MTTATQEHSDKAFGTVYELAIEAATRVSERWYLSVSMGDIIDRLMVSFSGKDGEDRMYRLHLAATQDRYAAQRAVILRAETIAKELDFEARQEDTYGQYTYQEIDVWKLLEAGYLLPLSQQGRQPANKRDYKNPDSVSYSDKADLNRAFDQLDSTSQAELTKLYRYPRKCRINNARLSFAVKQLTRFMNYNV